MKSVLRMCACAVLASAPWLDGADISGRVRVTKSLTKKKITVSQVYERAAAMPAPPANAADFLQEEIGRVVIYLEGNLPAPQPVTARIDQLQRRFEPDVVAIPVGSSVSFTNSDPIFHNVFSLSKWKSFDLGNYPKGQSRTVTFQESGVVQVYCHLHPNMSAAIVVTPTGRSARPDADGNYFLKDVPPGNYQLVAWHKSAGFFRRQIELKRGGSIQMDWDIPLRESLAAR